MKLKKNADITNLLTLKVNDAVCDLYFPESVDDIVIFTHEEEDYHVLAGGSNIIAGRIMKPVLYMGDVIGSSQTEDIDDEFVDVYMPAGAKVQDLLNYMINNELSGAEFMAGIPGTIGGAVCGNAAPKGETWDGVVDSIVFAVGGEVHSLQPQFEYRRLINAPAENFVVVAVQLKLIKSDEEFIKSRIAHYRSIRTKIPYPSAGSFFKNPQGDFAARLIEECGLKGTRVNDAAIYENHANMVVNLGNASYEDFARLRDRIMQDVRMKFGITLEPEVKFWSGEAQKWN